MPAPSQPAPTSAPIQPPSVRRPPPANRPPGQRPIGGCSLHSAATARIQRRLETWELEHLRTLAAEQAERIEQLERQLAHAEDSADFWNRSFHDLEEHLQGDTEDARCIGLTPQGDLLVVRTGAVQ